MVGPFFRLAMLSVSRQATFRWAVVMHLLLVGMGGLGLYARGPRLLPFFGQFLLVAGIVEGALLIGWRLTQLPKSQALEFLLVSPLRPRRVFLAEALVGLGRLALVTLASLPILLLLAFRGALELVDLAPLLFMPFTWGAITGMGLTVWAYETLPVRRWGERVMLLLILLYLVLGILAGENIWRWLRWLELSDEQIHFAARALRALHEYNPFTIVRDWLGESCALVLERMIGLEILALGLIGLLLLRGAGRLRGHFQDRHYRPARDPGTGDRGHIGDHPLSWWAVKRVTEYSGRINLWLAGGFGVAYAAYTLAGPNWPPWLGKLVFLMVDQIGGVPVIAAGLVVLAAVPAAFQYGLWDSNAQDRCRRLELLLLTELDADDYWDAAAAAAWRRGRGYFGVALLLWGAAAVAGRINTLQLVVVIADSVILWALYFALGFRAFSQGVQANGLGSLLTLGLPLAAWGLAHQGLPAVACLLPPGSVYYATARPPTFLWTMGPMLCGLGALMMARYARAHCDVELRRWYDLHHGNKLLD
jgi:hypothetical protein